MSVIARVCQLILINLAFFLTVAGEIIPLQNWQLDIDELKDAILRFVNDEELYQQRKACVQIAKKCFSIDKLVSEHEKFYALAIKHVKEKQLC